MSGPAFEAPSDSLIPRARRAGPDLEQPDVDLPGGPLADVLLRTAVTMADSLYVTDAQGRIVWANQAFLRFTGRQLADVQGRPRLDLSRGPATPQLEQVQVRLAGLDAFSAEFPTRDGAGTGRWVALSAFPYPGSDGLPAGLVGIERDVTVSREEAERRHRALRRAESLAVALEHQRRLLTAVLWTVPHVVWWKGPDLRYIGCNEAFLRLRGFSDQIDVIGRVEEQLGIDDELGDKLTPLESAVLETGRALVDVKITLDHPARTYQFNVQPYLDDGQLSGVVGIGADITHATELERQLAQANRLEAIGQLAAGIAHEINTPVQYASDNTRFAAETMHTVLRALRELESLVHNDSGDHLSEPLRKRVSAVLAELDLDFVAEEVPGALSQSLEGLDRVAQIVRAMKDFSHPGRGRAPADLNRLVTSTSQVSRNEWKYVAELDLELDPNLPAVPCYEGELKQVVLNIVVNAAHAIEERRHRDRLDRLGHIVIGTRLDGDEVRITVTDDGIGMDQATISRVFDPFFTTKEVGKGTGQGLTLARATMKKHGGRIEIASTPGSGSTFTIVLPRQERSAGDPATVEPAGVEQTPVEQGARS